MVSKKLVFSTLLIVGFLFVTAFSSRFTLNKGNDLRFLSQYSTKGLEVAHHVPTEDEVFPQPLPAQEYSLLLGKTFVGFKEALGFKESRGDYRAVNPFGYMGKYQFSKSTLAMIGVHNTEGYLRDTQLQEASFIAYSAKNKWILRRDIQRFEGRYINGVKITESGILAAAHLAGAGNVKKYLRSYGTVGFNDAFGTSIGYYLKKFSGYDTSFIKPNKRAKAT